MKKSVLATVIGGLIAGMLIMALLKSRPQVSSTALADGAAQTPSSAQGYQPSISGSNSLTKSEGNGANGSTAAAVTDKLPPPTAREIQSLRRMAEILRDSVKPGFTMDDLVKTLQSEGQAPFIARNGNRETGELIVVRTKNPLPGTRYFTAQYFTDADGAKSLQHISFEFKPGSTSYEEAVRLSREALGAPAETRGRFNKWNLPENRIHWISEPTLEQLLDNPINPHTKEDLGTVVFAIEDEIH